MLKKRIIFALLWSDGVFVLSRNFRHQRVGDLKWLQSHYDFAALAYAVDELVVLDVTRGVRDGERFAGAVSALAARCFAPVAAGGGIHDLEYARRLLRAGADKVVINTLVHDRPEEVRAMVAAFGAQAVVAAVDYADGEVVVDRGARRTGLTPLAAALVAEGLGVGEIYLGSVDRDGTGQGYDVACIAAVAGAVGVPLVAVGGVGHGDHLYAGLRAGADGAATANLFNFVGDGLVDARRGAAAAGHAVAQWPPGFETGRAGLVVTARSRSSRLPEKMLAPIDDRPALGFLLDRLAQAKQIDAYVLCTTTDPLDDRLASIALAHGFAVVRGDEEDVLARYLQAALEHELELVVNVDGDDLFCSVDAVADVVAHYRDSRADFFTFDGLPFGAAPVGVRAAALRDVCARKTERATQGWGKYFTKSGAFRVETLSAPAHLRRPELRLTLDYPEDLALARTIVKDVGGAPSIDDVVAWADTHAAETQPTQALQAQYWERFHREHDAFGLRSED